MKRKITVTDMTGKKTSGEINVRNKMHFEVQKNTRASVFTPKKGKGSYTRKQKHKEN